MVRARAWVGASFLWIAMCTSLVGVSVMSVSAPAHADVTITETARAHFKRGVQLLTEQKDYPAAYAAFQAAYADSPSPKILGNLGLAAMKLERDGEAIQAYERYLAEAGAVSETERRQIADDLVALKARVAGLRLTVQPPDASVRDERVADDGSSVVNEYQARDGQLAIGVRQGRHRLTIHKPGYEPATWEVEAMPGSPSDKSVTLVALAVTPPPAPVDPVLPDEPEGSAFPSVGFIVSASITGALGLGTIILGSLALSNKAEYEDALIANNAGSGAKVDIGALVDRGETLNTVTDVLLVGTIAGAVATTVFLIVDLTSEPDGDSAWHVNPSIGPDGAALSLGRSF